MANAATRTLPPEEIALFLEQVAMSLRAGIPLYDGMEALKESYAGSKHGERFAVLYQGVLDSGTLHASLEASGLFPPYLVGMVRIGEVAGKLEDVIGALARHYRREAETRDGIRNAIVYPSILVLMLGVVIAVLIVSVLPVFSRVFMGLGITASSPQAGLMHIGMGVGKGVLIAIAVLFVLLLLLLLLLRTKRRDAVLDFLSRVFPPVRNARFHLAAGRLASVVSIMLVSGNSIQQALELAPGVIGDAGYIQRIRACAVLLAGGTPLGDAIERTRLFQPMHAKMIRFGARAGQLDAVMGRLVTIYQEQSDQAISRLVSLIEPTLVALLSIVIGGILLTVTLPLLSVLATLAG